MRQQYIAVYLRLSQEDMELSRLKDESNSIQNQRLLIMEYIRNHPEWKEARILEFVDDGFTGTNFERPQMQKMLEAVRAGKIFCIIVKDLSRFGRSYLEVGDYLEHIFPVLGVRFISINDHFDSRDYPGTTGGIDVAFRNLVYQRYSQDLSKKVKSAMHMKMKKGAYVTHCPYGYMKVPGVKHRMMPDPITAPIVREIFLSAIAGMKTIQIAASLNEKGIPTPMAYKGVSRKGIHNQAMWSHQAVLRIIKDYKYTGAMVTFKMENETIHAKVQKRNDPAQWTIVEGCHEGIVSHEEYEAANAGIRKVRKVNSERKDQKDRVYYCAYCGRRLRKTYGIDEYYSCSSALYLKNSRCAEVRWSRTELEQVVLASYKAQLSIIEQKCEKRKKQQNISPLLLCRQKMKNYSAQIQALSAQSLHLYEQYKEARLDAETFLDQKRELANRKKATETRLKEEQRLEEKLLEEQTMEEKRDRDLKESKKMLQLSDNELKEEMYRSIKQVTVYASKELGIG